MQTWARWANRMAPIFDNSTTDEENARKTVKSDHDLARLALFGNNPNWTRGAQHSIQHAVSFARRYAENGDHEVSGTALNAVVSVNHAYIQAKGKTFFGAVPFFDNSLSTDGFINATLEHLRQNVRIDRASIRPLVIAAWAPTLNVICAP